MKIKNQFAEKKPYSSAAVVRYARSGAAEKLESVLLSEHVLDIYVNDELTMKLICTPDHLAELTMGRLLSEGIIRNAEEVDYLYICEYGKRARVFLRPDLKSGEQNENYIDLTPSCCTGNQILNDHYSRAKEPVPLRPGRWTPEMVFRCADRLKTDLPVHKYTRSTHCCFLLVGNKIVFEAEDIGRHNAIDKALGWALLNGTDLREAALFTSGRVPVDVAVKAIRAGVSVLISRKNVTKEALELAKQYHLTLIGNAQPESFTVYTSPGNAASPEFPE